MTDTDTADPEPCGDVFTKMRGKRRCTLDTGHDTDGWHYDARTGTSWRHGDPADPRYRD